MKTPFFPCKLFLFFSILLLLSNHITAQEFKTHKNGFIYSPETMSKLHGIVDSLNLKFRYCDYEKQFLSFCQGSGMYAVFKGTRKEIETLSAYLERKPDFHQTISDHANLLASSDTLHIVFKHKYIDYSGNKMISINYLKPRFYDWFDEISFPQGDKMMLREKAGEWIYIKGGAFGKKIR